MVLMTPFPKRSILGIDFDRFLYPNTTSWFLSVCKNLGISCGLCWVSASMTTILFAPCFMAKSHPVLRAAPFPRLVRCVRTVASLAALPVVSLEPSSTTMTFPYFFAWVTTPLMVDDSFCAGITM